MDVQSLTRLFLSENQFFDWATEKMLKLDEIIIVSHTPIIFFKQELSEASHQYVQALTKRLGSQSFRTTYFMSESELKRISLGVPGIEAMINWKREWTGRKNISPLVVSEGYFPSASFWIGVKGDKNVYTLIKIRFEKENKVSPIWIGINGELPRMHEVLDSLRQHSILFEEFLDKRSEALSSLEP